MDRLTLPTRVPVERAVDGEWLIDAAVEQADIASGRLAVKACSVPQYRAALAREAAATRYQATVPALWDQAVQALGSGGENSGDGARPYRERTPADLDLIEIMAQVRETVRVELGDRGDPLPRPDSPVGTAEIRRLASAIRAEHDLWASRFGSWCRAIENYLRVVRDQPRPFRLRAACPLCKTDYVRVDETGRVSSKGEFLAHPIKVDFAGDKMRAAVCDACGMAWFRGADMHRLARMVGCDPLPDASASA